MEFQQYAKGLATISEEDFARILLRYTNLSEASIEDYLDRVRDRIIEAKVCHIVAYTCFLRLQLVCPGHGPENLCRKIFNPQATTCEKESIPWNIYA